jgi:hypothetical protein
MIAARGRFLSLVSFANDPSLIASAAVVLGGGIGARYDALSTDEADLFAVNARCLRRHGEPAQMLLTGDPLR